MNANTQTANLLNSVADFLDSLLVKKAYTPTATLGPDIEAFSETSSSIRKIAYSLISGNVTANFNDEITEEAIQRIISMALYITKQQNAELHTNASTTITKAQALDLVKLLVSLESWSGPTKDILPDYLWLKVESQIKIFTDYILEGQT